MTLASNGLANAIAFRFTYADATARAAASGFTSADLYSLALQLDNATAWILTATTPTWAAAGTGMANPMTTAGDLILGGSSGTPGRLAKGADSTVLTIDPSTHLPVWAAAGGGGGQELGYAQITSAVTTTSPTNVDATGLSVTVTIGSRPVVITAYVPLVDFNGGGGTGRPGAAIRDNTAGANVGEGYVTIVSGSGQHLCMVARANPSAGSRTYKVTFATDGSNTTRLFCSSTAPAFILVEEV